MKSDLQVARLMAAAGAQGALANVEINLDGLKDANYVAATREKSRHCEENWLRRREPRAAEIRLLMPRIERNEI